MEHTPTGTPVGVDDPYEHADICDHVTSDGRCRLAFERPRKDPGFTQDRRSNNYVCPVTEDEWTWDECPYFRSRNPEPECARCGLGERRNAHENTRPLLEEHHLSYPDDPTTHEITVYLCRWCHAKIHHSWARITDDVNPDTEAIAALENRRSQELDELDFQTAKDRQRANRSPDNKR